MGDFDGHPFRGNQYTQGGIEQGRKDAEQLLRSVAKPGVGGKTRTPAEEIKALAAYHLRIADEQLRDKSAPEQVRVATSQFSIGRAQGLAEYLGKDTSTPVTQRIDRTESSLKLADSRGVSVSRGDYKAERHTTERIQKGSLGGRGRMSKAEFNRLADSADRGRR
jgi:hypothetical protein